MAKVSRAVVNNIIAKTKEKTKVNSAYSKMNNVSARIAKFKWITSTHFANQIPLYLALPFNLFDPADTTYNEKNRFIVQQSVETAWQLVHQLYTGEVENPNCEGVEEAEKYREILGIYLKDFIMSDLSSPEDVMPDDKNMTLVDFLRLNKESNLTFLKNHIIGYAEDLKRFENQFKNALRDAKDIELEEDSSETVLEAGWRAFKSAVELDLGIKLDHVKIVKDHFELNMWDARGVVLSRLLKDCRDIIPKGTWTAKVTLKDISEYSTRYALDYKMENGKVVFSGVLWDMSQLEQAKIRPELDEFNKKADTEGTPENKMPKQQKADARTAIKKKAAVSQPIFYNVLVMCSVKLDPATGNIKEEDLEAIKTKGPKARLFWTSTDKEAIAAYKIKLGSAFDKFPSFVDYRIIVGDSDDNLARYQSSQKSVATENYTPDKLEGFYEAYCVFRDDLSVSEDDSLLRSVPGFKLPDDNLLMEAYQNNLASYSRDVFTKGGVHISTAALERFDADWAAQVAAEYAKADAESKDQKKAEAASFMGFTTVKADGREVAADEQGNEIEDQIDDTEEFDDVMGVDATEELEDLEEKKVLV